MIASIKNWLIEHKLASICLCLTFLLFFASQAPTGLYYDNQNSYFPPGLRLAGRDYLQNDWYSNTTPNHIAFTLLVAGLDSIGILEIGVYLVEAVLYLVFLAGAWLLINGLLREFQLRGLSLPADIPQLDLACATLLTFVLALEGPISLLFYLGWEKALRAWQVVENLQGLAGQYIFGRYLQPCEFGVFILLGLGALLYGRWRSSAVLFGIACAFHVGYIPHCAIVVATIMGWLITQHQGRSALQTGLIFTAFIVPVVLYSTILLRGTTSQPETINILVTRASHHMLTADWWGPDDASKLGIMIAAAIVLWFRTDGVLRWVVVTATAYVIAVVGIGMWTGSAWFGQFQLWRASTFLFPLSIVTLFAVIVATSVKLAVKLHSKSWRMIQVLLAVALIVGLIVYGENLFNREAHAEDEFAEMVRANSTPQDVILIPPGAQWQSFRLRVQRPIYVDYKSVPFLASELIEWQTRIQFVSAFYQMAPEERSASCQESGAAYYVIAADAVGEPEQVAGTAEGYALVTCQYR